MNNIHDSGVVILDFGSQYTQLIARRVRELNVYSVIMPPETSIDKILSLDPGALILSGGPSSIYDQNTPDFDKKILGIHSLTFNSNILVNDFVRKEKID